MNELVPFPPHLPPETEEGDLAADDGEPLLDLVKVEADRVAGVQPAPRLLPARKELAKDSRVDLHLTADAVRPPTSGGVKLVLAQMQKHLRSAFANDCGCTDGTSGPPG